VAGRNRDEVINQGPITQISIKWPTTIALSEILVWTTGRAGGWNTASMLMQSSVSS